MILDDCVVVTMDAERRVITDAAIAVVDGVIAGVGKRADVHQAFGDEPIRDLHGWLVIPGLIDGHIHLPQQLLRGAADDVPFWIWMRERIFPLEGVFNAEDARAAARLAVVEMVKAGTTTFIETLILGRHDLAALAETLHETGIRAILPRAIADGGAYLDESPLHSGLMEDATESIDEAVSVAAAWRGSDRIRVWLGPRSTGGTSVPLLRDLVAVAHEHGLGLAHHFAMNDREVHWIRQKYGHSPSSYLRELGLLGPNILLLHCGGFGPEDVQDLRGTGTSVLHAVAAPMKVGSWLTPIPELLDAGVNVCLGTDAAAANNATELIRDLRWVGYAQKLQRHDATVVSKEQVLEMATLGGAQAVGMDKLIGSVEVGKRADLVVIRTDAPHWTPMVDPVSNLVFAASPADVDTVLIDGQVLMEGRRMTTLDEEEILAEARQRAADLYRRSGVTLPQRWPIS